MRAAPITWTDESGIPYAHTDYARLVMSQGSVVVVNDAEEDETARQKIGSPKPGSILGLGPNASATKGAQKLLAEIGIRAISTVGNPSSFTPLDDVTLIQRQAVAYADRVQRDTAVRRLYARQFVDSSLIERVNTTQLRTLSEELTAETYAKYVKRFKPSRFTRQPAGTDPVNRSITAAEAGILAVAADVCTLLNLSSALGFVQWGSRLSFAQDLADAFRLDITIPVGFLVGSQKPEAVDIPALVAEQLHFHRLLPSMITLAKEVLA